MNVKITIKQLGKKRDKIADADFWLENKPLTVRELIMESVHTCVREYNSAAAKKDSPEPLSEAEMENMSEIGKIAFGINYGGKQADEETAKQVAIQAFEDGLVRIFQGEEELAGLDDSIAVKEEDRFTFIRLAFLAGRIF